MYVTLHHLELCSEKGCVVIDLNFFCALLRRLPIQRYLTPTLRAEASSGGRLVQDTVL
jgi:hypothetical protein